MTESDSDIPQQRIGRLPPAQIPFESNYATPLIGQFLNLPKKSVQIRCPSCSCSAPTEYEEDITPRSELINELFSYIYVYCCLCCCMQSRLISKTAHGSHYCKNCGCYIGRYMPERKKMEIKKK